MTVEWRSFLSLPPMEEFVVNENNPNYKSIDGNLYNKDGTVLLQYAAGKKDEVFVVPEGVEEFKGTVFFGCLNLKKVILQNLRLSFQFLFFLTPTVSYKPHYYHEQSL